MISVGKNKYSSLADAVKAATDQAKKQYKGGKKGSVTVSLGSGDFPVTSKLTLGGGVSIEGNKESRIVVGSGYTGVVFNVTGSEGVSLNSLEVVLPKPKKSDSTKSINVGKDKALSLVDCTISAAAGDVAKLGLSVSGRAEVIKTHFVGTRVVFEGGSSGVVRSCVLKGLNSADSDSCGLSLFGEEVLVEDSEITGYPIGASLHGDSNTFDSTAVVARLVGLDLDVGTVIVKNACRISAIEGRAIRCRAQSTSTIKDSHILNSNVGITMEGAARMQMEDSKISEVSRVAIRVETEAQLSLHKTEIVGNGLEEIKQHKLDAITVTKKGNVSMEACTVANVAGRGVVVQGEGSGCTFNDLKITECGDRCILVAGGGSIEGSKAEITTSQGVALHLNDKKTSGTLTDTTIVGGNTGVLVKQGATGQFSKVNVKDTKKKGFEITDSTSTAVLERCNVFSAGLVAVTVKKGAKVTLASCNVRRAEEAGLKVIGANTECSASNCGFLQNEVGIYAESAQTVVDGCTFVESYRKSLEIHNMELKQSNRDGNLDKEAPIKLRWCNFIERLLQGEDVCNDMEKLNAVTLESSFYGAFDYEWRMYCSTLLERMRQAQKYNDSDEEGTQQLAQTIMLSVRHVYMLIPEVKQLILTSLAEQPPLGMFAFLFKMGETSEGLYTIDELVESWNSLPRTGTYDEALKSLDYAFKNKGVNEDLYDEKRNLVEEWQRTNFVDSKYNRRRDYLLTTALEDPLRCWYFLHKEKDDRLENEVLKFLAAPVKPEAGAEPVQHHFHGSWVGTWAIEKLGDKWLAKPPNNTNKDEKVLFRAWCNALLDKGIPKRVLSAYGDMSHQEEEDKLIQYEAHKMVGTKVSEVAMNNLFPGKDYRYVVGLAAKLFPGEGVLPGFFRRAVKAEPNPEMLLEFLSNVPFKEGRKELVLATMGQFYLPDDLTEPLINDKGNRSEDYDSCSICFVQKLFPWNELRLKNCELDHRYCLECIKESMSTGVPNLWGICPGEDDSGKTCPALATRRDMEMCGIEKEKIYNILERTIVARLNSLDEWRSCNAPGCIGGRSKVKLKYYRCRLCENMVTLDKGKTDPTVEMKLLKGLDVNEAKRGNGIYRECYHCAASYEKGNACSTLTCAVCHQTFSMSYGSAKITHRFDETGIQAQHYVPKKKGTLWDLGVFKDKAGKPLKLGQLLDDNEVREVIRRAKLKLREYIE